MSWYRKSAGLGEGIVLMSESEVEQLRAAQAELADKQRTIGELEKRLEELEKQPEKTTQVDSQKDTAAEIEALRAQVARLSQSAGEQRTRVRQLGEQLAESQRKEPSVPAAGLDFGQRDAVQALFLLTVEEGRFTPMQ